MSSNTACSHSQWFLTYVSSVYKQDRKLHYEATCQSELRSTTSEPKGVGTLSNLSGLLRACELSGCKSSANWQSISPSATPENVSQKGTSLCGLSIPQPQPGYTGAYHRLHSLRAAPALNSQKMQQVSERTLDARGVDMQAA